MSSVSKLSNVAQTVHVIIRHILISVIDVDFSTFDLEKLTDYEL